MTGAPAPGSEPPGPETEGLDALLDRLERQIARLADGSAPLDEVVQAHEEAQRLIEAAQSRLRELQARLEAEAEPERPAEDS